MSGGGLGLGVPYTVRSHVQGVGSLYSKVSCPEGMEPGLEGSLYNVV